MFMLLLNNATACKVWNYQKIQFSECLGNYSSNVKVNELLN